MCECPNCGETVYESQLIKEPNFGIDGCFHCVEYCAQCEIPAYYKDLNGAFLCPDCADGQRGITIK